MFKFSFLTSSCQPFYNAIIILCLLKVKASVVTDLLTLVGIPALDPSGLNPAPGQPKWSRYRNAAGIGKCRKTTSSSEVTASSSKRPAPAVHKNFLSLEEQRIVRHARAQYERKGGFVRIFPTVDSMQKYGHLLDPVTGIPMSTVAMNGSSTLAMILPHNYNVMLHHQIFSDSLFQNGAEELKYRMGQYERVLRADDALLLVRQTNPKSVDDAIRLRRIMRQHIENSLELSQLQARRLFHRYMECVLMRLATEPPKTSQQEKWILKFITRCEVGKIKTPSFIKNPSMQQSQRIHSRDRSALVAKLLGDYLETYHRESEAYVDDFDRPGIIPRRIFEEFLGLGQENDLESILTLHTNITQSLPFLNTRSTAALQVPPPIPTGSSGFLRALPSMVRNGVSNSSIDNYYKSLTSLTASGTKQSSANDSPTTEHGTDASSSSTSASTKQRDDKVMSTSINLPSTSRGSRAMTPASKRRSASQSSAHR